MTLGTPFTDQIAAGDRVNVEVVGTFASKNVGVDRTVSLALNGSRAFNYSLSGSVLADITPLYSATWVGGTTGQWFDPNNWAPTSNLAARGVVPDLDNVANVVIPGSNTVTFDSAGDPVSLVSLTGEA